MPLGLLALGSWLEGRHVVIVDGRFELAPEARVVELARNALLLGVSVRTGEPLREALRVSRAARAASPRLPVVWGGPHARLDPEHFQEQPLQAHISAPVHAAQVVPLVEVAVIQELLARPRKARRVMPAEQAGERLLPAQGQPLQLLEHLAID